MEIRLGTDPVWGDLNSKVLTALVLAIAGFAITSAGTASAAPGDLTQLTGVNGCITEDGRDGNGVENACIDGKGLASGVSAAQVTPDGKRLQVSGFNGSFDPNGNSILTFDRDQVTGSVAYDPRPGSCKSDAAIDPCVGGGAGNMAAPTGIAISPDSNSVYVSARVSGAVTIFDYIGLSAPNATSGPLLRKSGSDGCVAEAATGGCSDVRGLGQASDVVMSSDGTHVYTAGREATFGGIAIFDRGLNGTLMQKALTAGCVSDLPAFNSCADGNHLEPSSLAISADGKSLYASSQSDDASNDSVTVFDINPDGTIVQKAGIAGCFSASGSGGDCTQVPGLEQPTDISISPDGKNVYVVSDLQAFVDAPDVALLTTFDRNASTGTLTRTGCFAAEGANGCTEAAGLYRPFSVKATDEAVYVGSIERNADQLTGEGAAPSALVILRRNQTTGALNQPSGSAGCLTPTAFGDCGVSSTIARPRGIAVSPGGDNLYVGGLSGITVFDRDDGVAPVTTIDSGPTGNIFNASAVSFTFSADEPDATFQCRVDSQPFAACVSPKAFPGLALGSHTLQVKGTDKSGNAEATGATSSFTVISDPLPPSCATDATLCPPKDTKVDAVVTAAKVQKQKKGKIAVTVTVKTKEDITVTSSGSVKKGKAKAALRGKLKALVAGTTSRITLKPTKAGQGRLVAAALLGSKRAVPKIFITLTDGAENRLVAKPVVKVQGYKAKQGKTGSAR